MATVQMKVSLLHVRPTIWRRIRVPSSISLGDLHEVLQIAMGWSGGHLHQFVIDGEPLGEPGEFFDEVSPEEKATKLDALIKKKRFGYDYDFGDGWEHDIEIEQVDSLDANLVPMCVAGERSCPPEDCGGPGGYAQLRTLAAKWQPRVAKKTARARAKPAND